MQFFCRKCGAPLVDGASFCSKCGTRITLPKQNSERQPAVQTPPVQTNYSVITPLVSPAELGYSSNPAEVQSTMTPGPEYVFEASPGTAGIRRTSFSTSLLLFWLRGRIDVDYHFIRTHIPNTIFWLLPAGSDDQSIPLKNVSATLLHTSYKALSLIVGAFLTLASFALITDRETIMTGFFLLLLGIALIMNGFRTILIIQRAGSNYSISVPMFEKERLLEAKDAIDEALSRDMDKTDLNRFFGSRA